MKKYLTLHNYYVQITYSITHADIAIKYFSISSILYYVHKKLDFFFYIPMYVKHNNNNNNKNL